MKIVALASAAFAIIGAAQSASSGFAQVFGASAESVWLIVWGVGLLTSVRGVKRVTARRRERRTVDLAGRSLPPMFHRRASALGSPQAQAHS